VFQLLFAVNHVCGPSPCCRSPLFLSHSLVPLIVMRVISELNDGALLNRRSPLFLQPRGENSAKLLRRVNVAARSSMNGASRFLASLKLDELTSRQDTARVSIALCFSKTVMRGVLRFSSPVFDVPCCIDATLLVPDNRVIVIIFFICRSTDGSSLFYSW